MAKSKSRLGRGLHSLIAAGVGPREGSGGTTVAAGGEPSPPTGGSPKAGIGRSADAAPAQMEYQEVPVSSVEPSPYQARREMDDQGIRELADSIRSEGLLQPIVVRRKGNGFQLIAGERRWRACMHLNLKRVPARVVDSGDASSAAISLIENLQRENLNPLEEAMGFASLMRDFDLTQESVAERVGRGRATIANALRLLQLELEIQGYLSKGLISVGHAKVLLGIDESGRRLVLARRMMEDGLSVRDTERLVQRMKQGKGKRSDSSQLTDSEITEIEALERQLSNRLKTQVQLRHNARKGRIVIEYFGNDDLRRILDELGIG